MSDPTPSTPSTPAGPAVPEPIRPDDADLPPRPAAGRRPRQQAPTEHPHRFMLRLVRVSFFVLFITVTILAVIDVDGIQAGQGSPLTDNYLLTIISAFVIGGIIVAVDVFTPRKKVSTLFAIFFALMGAMVVIGGLGLVIDLLARLYGFEQATSVVATIKVLLGICVCYLAIVVVLQTQDDFRLVIPYVEFAKQIRGVRPMVLDTSVLVDARIVDIAATGILQAPIIVPRFVIGELQTLADSSDKLKRAKGRRGLSVVTKLQRTPGLDLSIDETVVAGKAVDQMLIELAQRTPGTIVTTDLGLSRVAAIQNVGVLNLNDLAAALRAPVAAGDRLTVRVSKEGEQPGQGVAYLDDGTMVVVEGGAGFIGKELPVTIGTSLHTAGGRLVFAKPTEGSAADISHASAHRPGGHVSDGSVSAPEEQQAGHEPTDSADAQTPGGPGKRIVMPPMPTDGKGPLGPGARSRPTPRNPRR